MAKLSELISKGAEIRLSNGKNKNILIKPSKNGWTTRKDDLNNKANRGKTGSVVLKEDPVRYIKKLYANQYKIVSPADVQLDWN
ncbi:MAG: hypothetical protein FWD37_03245 [Methanomassiliicoccaceae archaeon]|nr:hypothetical protein [Methanomassiliicoccaceae archaeon]